MSSKTDSLSSLESWFVLGAGVILFLWYAVPQIMYTLIFPYQVVQFLFPGLLPALESLAEILGR